MARNRAFASFKEKGELDIILADITQYISVGECVLDPMSGYGGGMRFWGRNGFKTTNVELNPPAYYWQVLNNPSNTAKIQASLKQLLSRIKELPQIKQSVSVSDKFFTPVSIDLISKIYELTYTINEDKELSIAIILPFVSRFAHYQRSSTNIYGGKNEMRQYGIRTKTGKHTIIQRVTRKSSTVVQQNEMRQCCYIHATSNDD